VTDTPVFRVSGLTYHYRRPRPDGRPAALIDVSVDLPHGVTAVLGRSGSGKTTLLNVLGLLAPCPAGHRQVVYAGDEEERDYSALSHRDRNDLRRRRFGFVLQSAYLLPHLSCLENVSVPLALGGVGRAERTKLANYLFERADPSGELFRLRHDRPREVSGGERQRVAVLRAIAHNPAIVFADEPCSSLDPFSARLILDLLRQWVDGGIHHDQPARRRALVLVSHTLGAAHEFAGGRCALMRDGRLVLGRLTGPEDLPGGAAQIEELIR
jgi:ABC-type lipoprotein export system ATPase subunit